MDLLIEHAIKGFLTMLLIAMPAVLTAASIGLVVGILQAVTQVQEQTIAAAPKVLGVFLMLMMMAPFSANTLMKFFKQSVNIAFNIVPRDEQTVLSKGDFYLKKRTYSEEKYYGDSVPDIKEIMKNPGKMPYAPNKYKESYTKTPKSSVSQPNFIEQKQINSGSKK